jgi:large subunit ribosomal protein L13e
MLRPIVRSCSRKYNTRERAGKGFTLTELNLAIPGLNRAFAQSIGIAVDHRRFPSPPPLIF